MSVFTRLGFIERISSFFARKSLRVRDERIWSAKFRKIEKALKEKKQAELEPLLEEVRSWLSSDPASVCAKPEWLNQTGLIYQAYTGNFVRAEEFFIWALRKAEVQKNSREKALAMTNLGVLYLDQNRPSEAVDVFIRLKPLIEDQFSEESLETATVCQNLAAAYKLAGDEEAAKVERIRATGILRKLS